MSPEWDALTPLVGQYYLALLLVQFDISERLIHALLLNNDH
jgi:hypothetical protein